MKNKKRKQNKIKKIALITIAALLIILLISVVAAAGHFLGKINRVGDEDMIAAEDEYFETDPYNADLEEISPDDIDWDDQELYDDSELINILVVGQDRREDYGRQRTDTMILLSFNPKNNKASVISFLRDLYVQIPGYSDNRLNTAYVFGGFSLLKKTLKTNFDISVDGCFEIDFNGFEKIIDILGGVDIELSDAEAKIIGDGARAGVSHLDGPHALMYARIRKLDSDFTRTERQRNIIKAVFNKVKDSSVTELINLVNTVLPYVTTNMSNTEITSLALKYAPSLAKLRVSNYHIPEGDCYKDAMIRYMAVLVPDLYKVKQHLFTEYLPFDR